MAARKTKIMGILNVTPDSFSDGGSFVSAEAIGRQLEQMISGGVDMIDVGGESTRPFAAPVSVADELERVLPAIEIIRALTDLPVSIDTTKAAVAHAALAAGATMINDISALCQDPEMVDVVKGCEGQVIIMHMQGSPGNMQVNPHYEDVVAEICAFFLERITWMEQQGIARERIIIDPGIGFGKTLAHNLEILGNIREFKETGCPVLIGHSRKSFFEKLLGLTINERDCPTAIVSALCALQGADILRVHACALSREAVQLVDAIHPRLPGSFQ